jgi:hypothetical protein
MQKPSNKYTTYCLDKKVLALSSCGHKLNFWGNKQEIWMRKGLEIVRRIEMRRVVGGGDAWDSGGGGGGGGGGGDIGKGEIVISLFLLSYPSLAGGDMEIVEENMGAGQ